MKRTKNATPRWLIAQRRCLRSRHDSGDVIVTLYDEHDIKPVIDIRNMRLPEGVDVEPADGEPAARQVFSEQCANIMYDYQGTVYCYRPVSHRLNPTPFAWFEKDRMSLKYICPIKK